MTHTELITRLYTAFQARDGAAMAACYHAECSFSDAAFVGLRGAQVGAMWRMLASSDGLERVIFSDVRADAEQGSAHWEAFYTFGKSRRPVHNIIEAKFTFRDGLILQHVDHFDVWRWSSQALGPVGMVLGWSPWLQRKVRDTAQQRLAAFMAKG
jgi:hypothetical protein